MATTTQTAPKLDFVIFYVSDLAASLEMFKKMGFIHIVEEDAPGFHQLRGGEGSPDFGIVQSGEQTPPIGTTQIYYNVNDLQQTHAAFANKDLQPTPIARMPFGRIFSVPNPDNLPVIMWS
jgi:predicted enzyme related to lactoylglutathione lyase